MREWVLWAQISIGDCAQKREGKRLYWAEWTKSQLPVVPESFLKECSWAYIAGVGAALLKAARFDYGSWDAQIILKLEKIADVVVLKCISKFFDMTFIKIWDLFLLPLKMGRPQWLAFSEQSEVNDCGDFGVYVRRGSTASSRFSFGMLPLETFMGVRGEMIVKDRTHQMSHYPIL